MKWHRTHAPRAFCRFGISLVGEQNQKRRTCIECWRDALQRNNGDKYAENGSIFCSTSVWMSINEQFARAPQTMKSRTSSRLIVFRFVYRRRRQSTTSDTHARCRRTYYYVTLLQSLITPLKWVCVCVCVIECVVQYGGSVWGLRTTSNSKDLLSTSDFCTHSNHSSSFFFAGLNFSSDGGRISQCE